MVYVEMVMMDIVLIRKLAMNWGVTQPEKVCPPEAKIVTGKPRIDTMIYYFEKESGVEIKLSEDFNDIVGYVVVDPEKLIWFTLQWS